MASLTTFGKDIKKRLVDLEKPDVWLIEQVKKRTGLYFDSSYLYKIRTGKLKSPKILEAICEILGLEKEPKGAEEKLKSAMERIK